MKQDNTMPCRIDWKKVFYFSFITETHKHKKRRVIPLSKLRKCIKKTSVSSANQKQNKGVDKEWQ